MIGVFYGRAAPLSAREVCELLRGGGYGVVATGFRGRPPAGRAADPQHRARPQEAVVRGLK
jgi:hypothetical protein